MAETLDDADRQLLGFLQVSARATLSEMAAHIHLSVSQTQRRLKRLEEGGVVMAYTARVDPERIGLGVMAFVDVVLRSQDTNAAENFHEAIAQIPHVVECHRVSGDSDYWLKVVARDLKTYSRLAQTTIMAIPEVERLQSRIVFETAKDGAALPL